MSILYNDWQEIIGEEFEKPYYQELRAFLKEEYQNEEIYPEMDAIFNALHSTAYKDAKVVILGQDPYHGPNQAHGLSFSVQPHITTPPSLRNMYKELEADLGFPPVDHGYLQAWANQGVLLLNTVLTVRRKQPGSHQGKGWELLTNEIIKQLNARKEPIAFVLWGKHAQNKVSLIDTQKHLVIQSAHPSPFSAHRGFLGSRPYSKINQWLEGKGLEPIQWQLPFKADLSASDDE